LASQAGVKGKAVQGKLNGKQDPSPPSAAFLAGVKGKAVQEKLNEKQDPSPPSVAVFSQSSLVHFFGKNNYHIYIVLKYPRFSFDATLSLHETTPRTGTDVETRKQTSKVSSSEEAPCRRRGIFGKQRSSPEGEKVGTSHPQGI
jgi:hypothetical protein